MIYSIILWSCWNEENENRQIKIAAIFKLWKYKEVDIIVHCGGQVTELQLHGKKSN